MNRSFNYIHLLFLLFCYMATGQLLPAQEKRSWQLNHVLNADNGLGQNIVNDLYFDQHTGFLWIATESGLVRYNGTSTKNFEISNVPSFKQARILLFTKTTDNRVIVADRSCQGVFLADQNPDSRYSMPFCESLPQLFFGAPLTICFQRNPSFQLMIDSGIAHEHKKIIARVNPAARSAYMAISYINDSTAIVLDDSVFIVGKNVAGFKIEGELGSRRFMHFSSGNKIVIWHENTFKGYLLDTDKKTILPIAYTGNDVSPGLSRMFYDQLNENNFIISDKKLYRFILKSDKLETELVAELPEVPDDISQVTLNEKDGRIYIGTRSKGLYVFSNSFFYTYRFNDPKKFTGDKKSGSNNFTENSYAVISEDSSHAIVGVLLPGGMSQAVRLSAEDGSFDMPFPNLIDAFNWTINKEHQIYVAYKDSLVRYITGSGKLRPDVFNIRFSPSFVYYDEKLDRVWLVSKRNKDISYIYKDSLYRYASAVDGSSEFGPFRIKRTNGTLIAFTDSILYRINETNRKFEKIYTLSVSCLRDVYIDQDNLVWMSTYGRGLLLYDLKNRKAYPAKNDARGYLRFSHCVVDDGRGNFFIPTNNGLFKVNRKLLVEAYIQEHKPLYYQYFDKTNGLIQNEFNGGGQPSFTKMPNGDMLLPSAQGLVRIPAVMNSVDAVYPLFIQEVKTQKQSYDFSSNMVFDKDERTITWEVNFAQWKHPFTSGLSYQFDNQDTWIQLAAEERTILLTDLKGGKHQLRVRNQFDLKGDKVSELVITFNVRKKYFEEPWFWIMTICTLLFAIYVFTAFRNRQLLRQNRRLEITVHKKTMEVRGKNADLEQALECLENNSKFQQKLIGLLGHDIMVPLQYIAKVSRQLIVYRQKLKEETSSGAIQEIGNTATQLLFLGESIIQWVKFQEGNFLLKYSIFNLYNLVEELVNLHQPIAAEKGNSIKNDIPPDLNCIQEPVIIRIVLHNLLLNANKFTTKGTIRISGKLQDNKLELVLSDTGIGMKSETVASLNNFQAVTSEKGTSDEKGWGLGYKFIISLIRFINGTLFIQSKKDEGTKVTIHILCADEISH